jgi:glycogen debranching enzyme
MTDSTHEPGDASLETAHAGPSLEQEEPVDLYVLQGSASTTVLKISLMRGDTFLVTDVRGDLHETQQETGLYWQGTRFLRTCDLFLAGFPLQPLSHSVADEGNMCQFNLCNPFIKLDPQTDVPQGTIHVQRDVEVRDRQLIQHIGVTSYHSKPLKILLGLKVSADFRDIFEVRGLQRAQHGTPLDPDMRRDVLSYQYRGRDEIVRETRMTLSPPVTHIIKDGVFWYLVVTPHQPISIQITTDLVEHSPAEGQRSRQRHHKSPHPVLLDRPAIHTDNIFFDRLLKRSIYDLGMVSTLTPQGFFPYAGVPWYACPFGRDGLITSIEFMPWFPQIARGTLAFLAEHQGTKEDPFTEEEPGKILHEYRRGELANCREIPFIPYYGTIDATPLFIMALESYIRWTDDLELLRHLWPNAEAAAQWMITYGDADGDGFLEYQRIMETGLNNQGWKDSWDAISHHNGALADPPIALCEVQGYAYAAFAAMSYLAQRIGKEQEADQWRSRAEHLREHFLRDFWWEKEGTFYLALDGHKEPCEVVASNAGHCLWTGIASDEMAARVVRRMMRDDMYTEWGIRTLSSQAARYNPMSYHNGSVWPHDTAIAAAGFARYGHKEEAGVLLGNLYGVSLYYERARLPELFCGFPRHHGYGPTEYPVACSPQSWATGAPFLLLSAVLGLQPAADQQRLTLTQPTLPDWIKEMDMPGLRLGSHTIHLLLTREATPTRVTIVNSGGADIRSV